MTSSSASEPVPSHGGAFTYKGSITWEYAPESDGEPDPGEIVWTWVSFEENETVGKDRPVAVIGRTTDGRLAAVMLSSRAHDKEPGWFALGSGPWDPQGRASWVRTNRILALHVHSMRREGAILDRANFERLASAMRADTDPAARGLVKRMRSLGARLRRRPLYGPPKG